MRRLLPCVAAALSCARAAPAPRTCAAQPTAAAVEKVGIHGDRALLPAQVAYRSYGEFVGIGGDLGQHIVTGFVDNPLDYLARPDTAKIKVFLDALAAGKLDPFTFITLQYDHTFGLLPGKPSPETMVADNDRATGLLVEAVSRSPFWQDTLILITEDDPAGSADHVDGGSRPDAVRGAAGQRLSPVEPGAAGAARAGLLAARSRPRRRHRAVAGPAAGRAGAAADPPARERWR